MWGFLILLMLSCCMLRYQDLSGNMEVSNDDQYKATEENNRDHEQQPFYD